MTRIWTLASASFNLSSQRSKLSAGPVDHDANRCTLLIQVVQGLGVPIQGPVKNLGQTRVVPGFVVVEGLERELRVRWGQLIEELFGHI